MFSRTKRASTAGSITCVVVPALPPRLRTRLTCAPPHSSAGFPSRALTSSSVSPFWTLFISGRIRQAAPAQALDAASSRRCRGRRTRSREAAPARRPTGRAWRRTRGAARSWRSSTPASRARRPTVGAHRYSPPIRYSYSASTFSSAGTTPSMRWPSSAMRPSARANCSRSRVITSSPRRSSFSLISVT